MLQVALTILPLQRTCGRALQQPVLLVVFEHPSRPFRLDPPLLSLSQEGIVLLLVLVHDDGRVESRDDNVAKEDEREKERGDAVLLLLLRLAGDVVRTIIVKLSDGMASWLLYS